MKVEEEIIEVLKECYDPEIPIDLWNLGLIYDINFNFVVFVVIQLFVIIATTMIWPALNSK